MTMPTTTHEAEAYLAEVREHLADLSEDERAELLDDLGQHLREIGSEEGGASLRDRLGDPAAYADELRTAAGLTARSQVSTPQPRVSASARLKEATRAAREVLVDLRPAWWLARGALYAALPFWLGDNADDNFPVPSPGDSHAIGLMVLLFGAALSVWLGRSADRAAWRRVGIAANAGVVLVALLIVSLTPTHPTVHESLSVQRRPWLVSPHGMVTNILPYDANGNPLEDVLLFDQDGRPLRVERQEWWADGCRREPSHPLAADGVPVEFSYPVEYRVSAQFEFTPNQRAGTQCLPEIPRPPVPVPTFPPDAGPEAAPPTQP